FGIILFFGGFRMYRLVKTIENTPTSKIRSIAMGSVEVFGKVVPSRGSILYSPFSNSKCVYYCYKIDEWRKTGKRSSGWVTVKQGTNAIPFFIQDGTGTVLIDSKGAEIDIPQDFTRESGIGNEPTDIMKKFMSVEGMSHEGWFGINKKMRYSESYIAPGDSLYVMGIAGDNPKVKDGSANSNQADIMIQKGKGFFYISDQPEKKVLSKLRWRCYLGIAGGAALIIGCLAILFSQFNIL
ncbi:MAG TPA: GIDE domain-containing protein, partial [Candidatus Nanoarchaeia archaeon]|nr:GIDE domain-containing protein [Candidatus Nanoarchaeia archaeon]